LVPNAWDALAPVACAPSSKTQPYDASAALALAKAAVERDDLAALLERERGRYASGGTRTAAQAQPPGGLDARPSHRPHEEHIAYVVDHK
jgi:hypothetical protein